MEGEDLATGERLVEAQWMDAVAGDRIVREVGVDRADLEAERERTRGKRAANR